MDEKTFSMSVGIRGTILGYDAEAAYSIQHGKSCLRGRMSVSDADTSKFIALIDEDISKELHSLLPDFLTHINAEIEFSYGYDHELFSVDTQSLCFTVIGLRDTDGKRCGSGFLCGVTENDSGGYITELIRSAKDILGIDTFYLYISGKGQSVDIGRLLSPHDKKETIIPPAELCSAGCCLYSEYRFSENRCGLLDRFLGELLGVKRLSFFAGKNSEKTYLLLSLPEITNNILSVKDLILEVGSGKAGASFRVSGELCLTAVPNMTFALSCTVSSDSLMLSAAAVSKDYVNLFGDFYLGEAVLNIGYNNGLTFGIIGEIKIRKLLMFGAIQLTYSGVLRIQLLSLATSKLSVPSLIENITGILLPGTDALEKIITIDYFDFNCRNKFQMQWFRSENIPQIISFFNDNITSSQFKLKEGYVSIKRTSASSDEYTLVDKYRMRHYYVNGKGELFLRPQFYYSDVRESFKIANGMMVSAGIFLCAKICVFGKISLKVLFSFRRNEGTLAFGMLSEINLGIIKITSSDYAAKNPIPIPKNSVLSQFLDISSKGVAFYFQASSNETSFYFDGKIAIAGLFGCQAQLFYQKGLIVFNAESTLLGMTLHISLNVDYRSFRNASFSIKLTFDTYKLEEALTRVKNRLNRAIETCRRKINDAEQSLQDAKVKVRKLYGEISNLDRKINECRNRLNGMNWFKKLFYFPIIGCEIAGLEIAKAAIYASIYIAEAALSVAQAAVRFAGKIGEGVLKLINGVITSVTSLFFIRKLEASISADTRSLDMMLGIEFVALGKEYSHKWTVQRSLVKNTDKGREAVSNAMLDKIDPDVRDLENGVVSGLQLKERYMNFKDYHAQEFKIPAAAGVLERNVEMMRFVQDAYVNEFGESLPDFEEMNERLLENIGLIEANIDISERAAALSEMEDTVDQLREITMSPRDGLSANELMDMEQAAEAVEKFDKAKELSAEMRELMGHLYNSGEAIRLYRTAGINNSQQAMRVRGRNEVRYNGSMYEYVRTVRQEMERVYADLPDDGYLNPYKDEQIWKTVLGAEEYFGINS